MERELSADRIAASLTDQTRRERVAYRPSEVAAATGLGKATIYELIQSGALRAKKFGRWTLVSVEALEQWIQSLPDAVPEKPRAA